MSALYRFGSITTLAVLLGMFSFTLSADQISDPDKTQKQLIDEMHHKLHDDQAPHKEAEARLLKELNELTVQEGVDVAEVMTKVDELMAAKTEIMRLRYDHLVEMRTILTDEQKVRYDQGVLARSEVK